MLDSWLLVVLAIAYLLYLIVEVGLDLANINYLHQKRHNLPEPLKNHINDHEQEKATRYTKTKTGFHLVQLAYQSLFIWILVLSNTFYKINVLAFSLVPHFPIAQGVLYIGLVAFLSYLVNLPFSWYFQFVVEEQFGFNKSNGRIFITDQLKGIFLAVLFGAPLLSFLLWLVKNWGDNWWLAAAVVIVGFQVLTAAIFPVFIVPLFYRLTPLPEGELKTRLTSLAHQLHFSMSGIFTIDGSKRSTHSNAFFTGLGKTKRIVLFDTLVENLSTAQITAVVAHEMGHYVRKHVQRNLLLGTTITFVSCYGLALCLKWPLFFSTFGFAHPSVHVGFVLFALFSPIFTFWLTPLFNSLSRKHEFEADAFAISLTNNPQDLSTALLQLSKDNLSNPIPHPWYSFYHYSHPTTAERIEAMESKV